MGRDIRIGTWVTCDSECFELRTEPCTDPLGEITPCPCAPTPTPAPWVCSEPGWNRGHADVESV
eukprot:714220-Rhodomonas_salina.1